eukprot:gi/632944200/ref/XP_007887369.1/ PREDICTED: extracellular superoxide dismutase [Cu-Zn]-like [Callorhinchus milii]
MEINAISKTVAEWTECKNKKVQRAAFHVMQTLPTKDVEGYFQLEGIPKFYAKLSVHQYGEVTDTCNATGPQYNPMELEQEYGDIPKVEVKLGNIGQYLHSLQLTLFGPHSIYGRSVVVRAGELTEEKADKKVPLAGVGHSGKTSRRTVVDLESQLEEEK